MDCGNNIDQRPPLVAGDIVGTSNLDTRFYEIIEMRGIVAILRRLAVAKTETFHQQGIGSVGQCRPIQGVYIGAPFRKRLIGKGRDCVRPDFDYAWKWDGKLSNYDDRSW